MLWFQLNMWGDTSLHEWQDWCCTQTHILSITFANMHFTTIATSAFALASLVAAAPAEGGACYKVCDWLAPKCKDGGWQSTVQKNTCGAADGLCRAACKQLVPFATISEGNVAAEKDLKTIAVDLINEADAQIDLEDATASTKRDLQRRKICNFLGEDLPEILKNNVEAIKKNKWITKGLEGLQLAASIGCTYSPLAIGQILEEADQQAVTEAQNTLATEQQEEQVIAVDANSTASASS